MNITDSELLYLSGYSVLLGAVLAVCYGLFSFVRVLVSPLEPHTVKGRALSDLAAFITDVLYSLFAGVCVALMFFGLNSGRVRLIGLAGCAVGFSMYHFTLGRWSIRTFTRCVGAVRRGIRFAYSHTVGFIIKLLANLIKKAFHPIFERIGKKRKLKKRKRKAKYEKLEFLG